MKMAKKYFTAIQFLSVTCGQTMNRPDYHNDVYVMIHEYKSEKCLQVKICLDQTNLDHAIQV